jgi:hypothetical protein
LAKYRSALKPILTRTTRIKAQSASYSKGSIFATLSFKNG